ncbi:PTS sugar transporter subunit IIA [Cytobacillus sp. Hz8]|uniref:PTS sugar transporter subunit IIA n=1 Tax=Cytobacillus sp. Hz8 TaxID=3347168 RepID=UPI0035E13DD9
MLSNRQYSIIDLLVKTSTPINADSIAKVAIRSKRTIMRDLSAIKTILESNDIGELLTYEGLGYKVEISDFDKYEDFMKKNINDEEIILYELIQNDYVTIEDLSEKLYVSKITASEKLNVIKEGYGNLLNIDVCKKGHFLNEPLYKQCILLSNIIENNIKRYMDKLEMGLDVYEKLQMTIDQNDEIRFYFPNVKIAQINKILIAALLFRKGNLKSENSVFEEIYNVCGLNYRRKTIGILSQISDVCIDINLNLTFNQVEKALDILQEQYAVNFGEELSSQLYHHLKRILSYPCYLKIKEIHNISNIKATYPFSFDLSITFIDLMKKMYHYQITNWDLIGLYFAVSLEKNKKTRNKILIYSTDNAIANINKQLLEDTLSNCDIVICDDEKTVSDSEANLIINSNDQKSFKGKETILVHYILSEPDINLIQEKIERISVSKNIETIFLKDYSYTYDVKDNENFLTVLSNVCNHLLKKHVINLDEAKRIEDREKQGNSLIIRNYSIPHCISKKDDFCICIYVHLSKEIYIDDISVNHMLITLMSTKLKSNLNIFKYLYRYLKEHGDKLENITSYNEFIKYI